MNLNYLLGIALLAWVAFDLITGKVYLHRQYERSSEPLEYWFGNLVWLSVAATCFIV